MNTEELTRLVVEALEDVKAKDIKVFNTEKLTDQFERVVIARTRANGFSSTAARSSATACSRPCASTTTSKRSGAAAKSSCRPCRRMSRAKKRT